MRQIFQGQSQIFEQLRDLSRKVDEVIGRQENTLSLVSRSAGASIQQVGAATGAGVPPVATGTISGTITRPEVDLMVTNQNALLATAREIRTLIVEIQIRADTIIQNQQRAPTAQVQATGYDIQSVIAEMRDGMNQVKQGMAHVGQK